MSLLFIEEGHYKEGERIYLSIWTYKKLKSIKPNDTSTNYNDAKNIICSDRKWLPFNESNRFKEGWHYEVNCLDNFYSNN